MTDTRWHVLVATYADRPRADEDRAGLVSTAPAGTVLTEERVVEQVRCALMRAERLIHHDLASRGSLLRRRSGPDAPRTVSSSSALSP